ncbi:hypothetical protein [Dyella japonica]|uniref:Uncharacterized protein n=1 Tax=Dyella japonica TaxID=231455 RepID=A0ABV2JUS7_9GAMM
MNNLRSDIVLSANRALLGQVFPELVAVSCTMYNERKFELTFFVDSAPPAFREEDISCIETEVIADFPENFEISHRIVLSKRAALPAPDAFWIFLRKLV